MTERDALTLRILLADGHEVIRHGLRVLLESQPGWEICGEAPDGAEAVRMAGERTPDIAILDPDLISPDGIATTRLIRQASPGTEVLIFALQESEQLIREALAAGAKGYLLKSDAGRLVVSAVEALALRHPFFSGKVSDTILGGFLRGRPPPDAASPPDPLSARERQIVQLLAEGLNNREIAARLAISIKTVETHRASLMRKLDAHSVVDVVRYALRNRLTSI